MHDLAPFQTALGPQPINPHLYATKQVTLQMKERVFSLSGDDFSVTTTDGLEVCRCKGKVMSLKDKKVFTDINGAELFTLKNKMLSLHKSFHGESPSGHGFEVKGHFKLIGSASSVTFKNAADGAEIEMHVKGDWMDRSATIKWDNRVVAEIQRSYMNFRQIFGEKQTYFVTVAANVDLSLIAGICVALDERENESD